MRNLYLLLFNLLALIFCSTNANAQGSCADGSYQWSDIATIFQNNGCYAASCHGGAAASGLDLTTYAGFNAGGTKCPFNINSGTTLVDIIQVGGVMCVNGTVINAMNSNIASPMPAADIAAIQTWIDSGAFENCRGIPEDDGLCIPQSTIGILDPPAETVLCSDGSNAPTFSAPASSLPDVEIGVEVNGVLVDITSDGSFDTSTLAIGDEVCYTAFSFDLVAVNDLINTVNTICGAIDCDAFFGIPGIGIAISDLVSGNNDGTPGLNNLNEALDFVGSFGSPIQSVQSAVATLNNLNVTIGSVNLGPVCFAASNNVCLLVEECANTCPTVILNDSNIPFVLSALCVDDVLSLCFDLVVDEATFDPSLIQLNYILLIEGQPSSVTLNTTYTSGAGIDPNATGQLCFEGTIPVGDDPCVPYNISLEIVDVFYNDPDCANNFIAYDLNITDPISIMQAGDDLNDLIPLLPIVSSNPFMIQIFPNPNWTASITQLPACDGTTLGIIEISAADGTICETLTDIGTAGMDGCPPTDAIFPATLYAIFDSYTTPNGNVLPNPCFVGIGLVEQIIPCEDQCIMCPTVVSVEQEPSVCQNLGSIQFCVTFDMAVDANTVVTVEGIVVDGSAGGTQICADVPFTPPFDPCNGAAIGFVATAICNGTDLLDGFIWLDTQILPITDPACGGVAGCMDDTACNYNPSAVCDDPAAPCLPTPTCNTDPCVGDTEIIDPNDACVCIVDEVQVLGCTDTAACNFDMAANCDDGMCDSGNTACADPCNEPDPDDGCALTTDTFDATTCTVTNEATCPAGEIFDAVNCACVTDIIPGCTDPCADNYDMAANEDDDSCIPYDMTCNTDCTTGDLSEWDAASCMCVTTITTVLGCTDANACNFDSAANCDNASCDLGNTACTNPCDPPSADDGCDITTDTYDETTCTVTNTPSCAAGETFDATNCLCTTDPIMGCTNACADNYDPNATIDDGNCMFPSPDDGCDLTTDSYDDVNCVVINEAPDVDDGCDLTTDAFDAANCVITNTPSCATGESFDSANCLCTTDPIMGCTNACADNYDPNATIDDGNCMFPSPDDGCDLTTDSYDDVNCVVINDAPDPDDGCNLTTDSFDAGTCMITNTPNCPPGETFDALTCTCFGGTPGCLDSCDQNYDPNATVDDPNLCAGYDTTCNTDCLAGDLTIWNAASCSCLVNIVTVLGCTDSTADNYDAAANCDDGSCIAGSCEDMITGSVFAQEIGCSAAGIEVTIYDFAGAVVGTAITDADGNYTLMALYPCGNYTAELTANTPDCYIDSGGVTGPIGFVVDGDGVADGANFTENPQIPTLSQWGLIILALLLMTFGALSLGFNRFAYLKPVNS